MTTLKEYNYEKEYIQLDSNRSYWNKRMYGKGNSKARLQFKASYGAYGKSAYYDNGNNHYDEAEWY